MSKEELTEEQMKKKVRISTSSTTSDKMKKREPTEEGLDPDSAFTPDLFGIPLETEAAIDLQLTEKNQPETEEKDEDAPEKLWRGSGGCRVSDTAAQSLVVQPETNGKDGDTTAKSEAEANVYGDKTSEAKVNGDKTSEDLTFSSKIELDQEGLTLAVEKRVAQDPPVGILFYHENPKSVMKSKKSEAEPEDEEDDINVVKKSYSDPPVGILVYHENPKSGMKSKKSEAEPEDEEDDINVIKKSYSDPSARSLSWARPWSTIDLYLPGEGSWSRTMLAGGLTATATYAALSVVLKLLTKGFGSSSCSSSCREGPHHGVKAVIFGPAKGIRKNLTATNCD